MLLALALIIGAIIVVISIIVFAWQQQGQSKLNKKEEPVLPEVEEIVYDPVEADQWFEIERLFKQRYNVLEVVEAHDKLFPSIEAVIARDLSTNQTKAEIQWLIENYTEEETRKIAHEVLMEFVEGYTAWDMEYLMGQANNTEKNEVLYLFEIQHLKSIGIVLE